MIGRWNETVGVDDTVYHLGDFAFGSKEWIRNYRYRLNGHIVLVLGNHDRNVKAMSELGFEAVRGMGVALEVLDGGATAPVLLAHKPRPMDQWCKGVVAQVCGHVHERWSTRPGYVNVGVDVRGFRPMSHAELIDEVRKCMAMESDGGVK